MWKFLGSVISGFLFLRDLFGYILPGAVFLAMVIFSNSGSFGKTAGVQYLPSLPPWFIITALVVACYVAGHILVAMAYGAYGIADKIFTQEDSLKTEAEILLQGEPKIESSLLYYRYLYPQLFNERDRRATVNVLRIGLASAFCVGSWLLPNSLQNFPIEPRLLGLGVGLLMIVNGYTGQKHVTDYSGFTLEAARKAEQNHIPFFRWDGCCEKKDSEKEE